MPTSSKPFRSFGAPAAQGLYDPENEHDACGVAFVATLRGTPGRDIVDAGLTALLFFVALGRRHPDRETTLRRDEAEVPDRDEAASPAR